MRGSVPLWWALAPANTQLDPARYLGELNELPEPRFGGDWCDVTIRDDHGELHWRLVAVEAGRQHSLFEERRAAGHDEFGRGLTEPLDTRGG